jgi:serine protease Do
MDEQRNYNEPWDSSIYGTGRTKPPKNHGGLIAVLLVVVIFLGGLVSVLGILNIKLSRQLKNQKEHTPDALSVVTDADAHLLETSPLTVPTEVPDPTEHPPLQLAPTPDAAPNVAQEGGLPLQQIYADNIHSVVSISCTLPGGSSTGTGVVLSSDGYIVTNAHVVADALTVTIDLTDGRSLPATLIGSDAVSDLAVLHIPAGDLIAATFGDSTALQVGDSVTAIGDPLGRSLRGTFTDGIVSAINRDVTVGGRTMTLIQTNAALNSGNSGGPLINCYGQVIGINTLKIGNFVDSAGVEGIGFAIPSSTVKVIVDQLIEQGYVSGRPTLGIRGESVDLFYQRYYMMPAGLFITQLDAGSDAARKGIQTDDILMSINGTRILSMDDLNNVLYGCEVGDTVEAVIFRAGKQYLVSLTVAEAKGS